MSIANFAPSFAVCTRVHAAVRRKVSAKCYDVSEDVWDAVSWAITDSIAGVVHIAVTDGWEVDE